MKLVIPLEEGEDFLDVLNPCTKKVTAALGDANMQNLKRGDILQLERKGYFRLLKPIVLFAIPDGRQQTVLKGIYFRYQTDLSPSSVPRTFIASKTLPRLKRSSSPNIEVIWWDKNIAPQAEYRFASAFLG
ncbi:hypothetical protein SAY87_029372 [Trapa incisa]|uniref:tRNA synthetases class I (E and Q) anti-codon binding domain-containing protein n=1 Tax=Trapa incisa TaxID=236973 RepID=A0AAN7K4C6_9MYRT|nr:hypothetical protein SAY87_029372 [Trapa incisa]